LAHFLRSLGSMRAASGFLVLSIALGCERPIALEPFEPPGYVAYARTPDPPTTIEPAPFSTCVPSIVSGEYELELGGEKRTFLVDIPEPSGLRPLVLAFHGWGGDPVQLENTTKIASAALGRGWVVARPLGIHKSFDGGACCGEASERRIDDVGFARAIVEQLTRAACVDRSRVYATGFSNGGFLSHRLGCEASDMFVAVASVAGTLGVERCTPSQPVSALHIHGRADGIVPFAGDSSKGWRSVATTIDSWVTALGCASDSAEESYAKGNARCVRNAQCDGGTEVILCRDEKAMHTWPGGPKSFGCGGTQDLDATSMILDFFARHAR
jgi:polyhydroxybutyrate depolymerase